MKKLPIFSGKIGGQKRNHDTYKSKDQVNNTGIDDLFESININNAKSLEGKLLTQTNEEEILEEIIIENIDVCNGCCRHNTIGMLVFI